MRLRSKKLVVGVAAALAGLVVSCRYLLPERFAVNAPLAHLIFGRGGGAPPDDALGSRIRVPEGFSIGIFAADLPGLRFLRFTATGDLLVSQPRSDRVVLLHRDEDGDGRSDGRDVLLDDLDAPHGLDLHDGWLYVAETGAVVRIRFDAETRRTEGALEQVVGDLPSRGNHWTRTVRVGPDERLYVSVGSSCNVCEESDPRRAAILRYDLDGSNPEIYATGLRNAVGFDWQPGTGDLYATDNGRDLLGDDFPPCELNRIERGGFYGWPYANGDNVPDPDLGDGHEDEIRAAIPPVHGFRAHNAPLGIAFARGRALPRDYRGAAFTALHGSWNRTRKDGYAVVSLHFDGDTIEERDCVVGFEEDEDVIGRPVDVAEGPDGAIFVSDDYAGVVYRIAYGGGRASTASVEPPRRADSLETLSKPDRTASAERGAALYDLHDCARCHAAESATPGFVVVELEALPARYDLDGLAGFLAAPTPPMPAFPLDDEERRDLAVYLLENHP